jgi:2-polyprenyl-3-methyl-5-hydroxy-6-metoxy-1,4-benzoquinol methylase
MDQYLNPRIIDVLDIGCNVGFFTVPVAPNVHSIVGIRYNGEDKEVYVFR